jgi:hypothetical protein
MIDRGLERLLMNAARDTAYPRTPDLSAAVQTSLRAPVSAPTQIHRPAFVALVALVLVVLATLAISPTRDAIARLFGVEGSKIEFLPTPLPGETATPFPTAVPTPTFSPRAVGIVPIERVHEFAGFEPVVPLTDEQRIFTTIGYYGGQAVVQHHYAAFELWQTKLRQDAGFGKGVPEGGFVQEVEVGSVPGVWVTGAPHYVYYYDERGTAYLDSQRVVDRSTLIWRTDAFFYRIETDLSLEEAIRIAETLP